MNRLIKEAHAVEEINGVRCAVVEKDCSEERIAFLKKLLEFNRFSVELAPMPPPKAKAKPAAAPVEGESAPIETPTSEPTPTAFMIGVNNILFHPMLAVYERTLKTPDGQIVSINYWNQESENAEAIYWM